MRRSVFYALATGASNGVRTTARAFDPANGPRTAELGAATGAGSTWSPRNNLYEHDDVAPIFSVASIMVRSAIVNENRERLGELLRRKSLFRGDITLSSGRKSSYYLDCKLTTLDPEGALLTGYSVLAALDSLNVQPDAIGGLTMGADPIVSATIIASQLAHRPLAGFLVRKEPKKHGRTKQIEGVDPPPKKVAIVDEVCTTGGSTWEAVRAVQSEGCEVVAVIILVDREEDDAQGLRSRYNYRAIFTARELLNGTV